MERADFDVVAGAGLCLVGIVLFQVAYPEQWTTGAETLAEFPRRLFTV